MYRSSLVRLLGSGVAFSAATAFSVSSRAQSTLPKVYFDVEANGKPLGRVVMEVSGRAIAPGTVYRGTV